MKNAEYIFSEKERLDNLKKVSIEKKIPIISYEVGRLLESIVFLLKPESILEIGCAEGYSSYFLIKNMPEYSSYTGIDLNKERLYKAKQFISSNYPELDCSFFGGNALNIIPTLEKEFDFIFIDGAKFEYPHYLIAVIEKLKAQATIITDNIFYSEKIFSNIIKEHDKKSVAGLKNFIELINNKNMFDTVFIDIGDGVSISRFKKP